MKPLFNGSYNCDTLSEMFNDITKCFDPEFNSVASEITKDTLFNVHFILKKENNITEILVRKIYEPEFVMNIEHELSQSLINIDENTDSEGSIVGEFKLLISFFENY